MKTYDGMVSLFINVNGQEYQVNVRPADTLLHTLRDQLGLTGAKIGCENGDCGACTVLLDGNPVKSCMILTVSTEGQKITTVEGLRDTAIQRAFVEQQGFQCGFCTPGFIVNSHALLQAHPKPDEQTMKDWLQSNICRCTGYEGIERAVRSAGDQNLRKT
jgi:carbon-monoxide dehydrogenase small subunit